MENIILTNNKDLRLVGVKVGVLSTLRFELPLVSASATHVEVIVTSGDVHSAYTATFIPDTKRWQCDIAASQFPAVGKQSYEIAYVLDGKQFWDGKGWIEIEDATTSGIEPQPRPEPYRYAVVSVNGYGADAQGAVRIPKTFISANSPATTEGYMEGDIYFNRETGAMWTLCNVQGTLTWVFNYKNYYTKAETDEAIDRVAAYYITYDAAGNPFPTYASLANAQTVYSGGVVRIPTRNDYCVVLADETHDNAEYRYIYAVAQGETTGSWQPQFPVEGVMTVDPTVTKNSQNPVASSGIWSAIWGALASLPSGFSSLYDWCVSQLAGKVPTSRTVNGKALSSNVTLDADDVGALPSTYNEGNEYVSSDVHFTGGGGDIDLPLGGTGTLTYLPRGESTTQNNLAAWKTGGGLTDSGKKPSDFQSALSSQQLANIAAVSAALAFDATHSYAAGDPVVYNGMLYTFTTAHTGAWTGNDVSAVDIIARLASKLDKSGGTMTGDLTFEDGKEICFNRSGGYTSRIFYDGAADELEVLTTDGNGGVVSDIVIPTTGYGVLALKSEIPYDLGTPIVINTASSETVEGETVYYGAATLANRTANIVQVTAATALDELRITFPAATSGKVRDFGLRVEIGTGSAALTAPALVPIAPTGETIKIENNAAEIPALADGTATAEGVTLLYFSENAPGVFVVKGEQVEEVA